MPSSTRRVLGRFCRWALAAEVVFFLAALHIATFGYFPVLPRDTQILHRALIQLGAAIILAFLFSIICAFAYDIEARPRPAQAQAAV
jgi:amino acid transporter